MKYQAVRNVCVVAVGWLLGGCAQAPVAADATSSTMLTPPSPGEAVSPAMLVKSGTSPIGYTSRQEQGATLHVEREGAGDTWLLTEEVQRPGKKPSGRTLTVLTLPDGALAISHEVNRGEKVTVDFEPPLVIYPASLQAGRAYEQSLHMTVHPMAHPDRIQAQGDAKHTITFDGHEPLETGAGVLQAVKITALLTANLGGPQVRNETLEWLAPTFGVIGIKQDEQTTLFGARVRANTEWWVFDGARAPEPGDQRGSK